MVRIRAEASKRSEKMSKLRYLSCVVVAVFCIILLTSESINLKKLAALSNNSSSINIISKREYKGPEDSRACIQNPYAGALNLSLNKISAKMDDWLHSIPAHLERADRPETRPEFERFFVFDEMATCDLTCIGGECRADTSKIACGIKDLQPGCVIYSIGGNNKWQFEEDILKKTPCEVHTFDCTGETSRFQKPDNDRLKFHHICLGSVSAPAPKKACKGVNVCGEMMTLLDIQKMLGHTRIDLLKMDIEGFEWPIFQSWKELSDTSFSESVLLPMQILVEIHYYSRFKAIRPKTGQWEPRDMVDLQAHLLRMGYVTVHRDDNLECKRCTELTLIRALCPKTGVYALPE